VVHSYTGHGIGTLFHTAPTVLHYKNNPMRETMQEGHVFTIEPMVNASKNYNVAKWPDQWTIVTVDAARSAQLEHTLLITTTGVEILTKRIASSPPLGFENELDPQDMY